MEALGGKYAGIYTKTLDNGVVSFFISFRDENQKVKRIKIGQSPEMTKTKALVLLNEKKQEIADIKTALKGKSDKPFSLKKKVDRTIYSLNDLADFYIEDHAKSLKNPAEVISKYNYHIRNELFAQKPIQLILEEELIEFMNRKKAQKADKRQYKQEGKTVEEKEASEYYSNVEEIKELKMILESEVDIIENPWIYENKIKYLEKKNKILETRLDPNKFNKIWNDRSLSEDDKRSILGLLSNKTLKGILNTCSTIVNYANTEKKLNLHNHFVVSKKSKLYFKVDNIKDRFLTKEEITVFLKEIKRISKKYEKHKNIYLMCMFGLSLAARQSTIMTIRISDIDLENGDINLRNHKTEKWYNGFIANEEVKAEIINLIRNREQDEYLFVNWTGERPYRYPRKVQEVLDYTVNCHRPFLKWLSIKDFRNTAASHLAISGMPIQHISKVLDHADIRITQRYAHLSPSSSKEGVKDMFNNITENI